MEERAATTYSMPHASHRLSERLDEAVLSELARVGAENGLPPIEWLVVHYPDGPVIEGFINSLAPASIQICECWAQALDLNEYQWQTGVNRDWYADFGHWHLELFFEEQMVPDKINESIDPD